MEDPRNPRPRPPAPRSGPCAMGPRDGLGGGTAIYRLYGRRGLIGCGTARELAAATGLEASRIVRAASRPAEGGPWAIRVGSVGGTRCGKCAERRRQAAEARAEGRLKAAGRAPKAAR